VKLEDFKSLWVIDTEFKADDGELPTIHCLVAREVRSGRVERWRHDQLTGMSSPPFDMGDDSLMVGYYLPAEYGCFLQLGWPRPVHSLDLCTEFKWLRSGIRDGRERSLVGALTHFNLINHIPAEKREMRELAIRGGPFSSEEMEALIDYCHQDVDATAHLLRAMESHIDLPRALLRGCYCWTVAQLERNGTPLDAELLQELRDRWDEVKSGLIATVDTHGIYVDGHFSESRFGEFLARHGVAWPRLASGRLALDDDTFRQQGKAHPNLIAPYHELRTSLNKLKLNALAVGGDGRNRTMLSPYGASTGRHTPSNTRFIFGPATWIRGLIKPPAGRVLAYIDYKQQELGIAAALSGDKVMQKAYTSGDPYLTFACMAGAVPEGATKRSHPAERAVYKTCMLAVQYGMGAKSLATQTNTTTLVARRLLQAHRDAFPVYWDWADRVQNTGYATGRLTTRFGWQRNVSSNDPPASVRNFPIQGNGAEMLRLALMRMVEQGMKVCAPIHDAVLIEAEIAEADHAIATACDAMRWASQQIHPGFLLDVDVKRVTYPQRYMDKERGLEFWNTVMGLLGRPTYSYV